MSIEYKFLILEDVETDAELIMDQIKTADIFCTFECTDNEVDFKKLIDELKPDLVLSDYSLPGYDGMSALSYVLDHSPNLPVIIVTGSMNEETAVSCMKAGAVDYILKDNMSRLGLAVLAALDKKKLKMELFQAQKMEAIGTLAGGIAHDFNNLLGVIIGYSDYILDNMDNDDQIQRIIKNIKAAGQQGAVLTTQLLAFSRKQVIQTEILSLNMVIAETEKMLNRLLGEDIELVSEFETNLWEVEADHGQISQILMNLLVNARDSMTNGGKIVIRTENLNIEKEFCRQFPYARPGKFICFSIEDEGVGIEKDILSHIFEPFFTTKETGKGTGLGLSVIYGIVKQHNGWVNVESEPGQGSVFSVYLPASTTSVVNESVMDDFIENLHGHNERVLLVEDQEMLRGFAAQILSENGYIVSEVEKAEEAVELFEKEEGAFDIVFSDVVLPGINGVKLADSLQEIKPELKVLLTSGYMDDKSQWSVIQGKGYSFLQKPYTLREVLKSLKEALK